MRPFLRFRFLIGSVPVVVLLLGLAACEDGAGDHPYTPGTADSWAALKTKAIREVRVAEGWAPAKLMSGSVNSIGWEDSVCISNDGKTLWFSYIPCDLINWMVRGKASPGVFATYKRGPVRSSGPEFSIDVLECRLGKQGFGAPAVSRWSSNTEPVWQSESGLSQAGKDFVWNTNYPATADDHDTDIYFNGERLPAPVNTDKGEDDPFYRDGELFFWSADRVGGHGRKELWSCRRTKTGWTVPRLLPPPINQARSDNWQCHLTADGFLCFASNRSGPQSIWGSHRRDPEAWEEPVKLVWPGVGSKAVGINEPSLTQDGRWMCFVVLFQDDAGAFDLDIGYTHRK